MKFMPIHRRLLPLLMSVLLVNLMACGVEIGNPSDPVPVQPKTHSDPNSPTDATHSLIIQLATSQHDEAILALTARFDQNNYGARLLAAPMNGTSPSTKGPNPLQLDRDNEQTDDDSSDQDFTSSCKNGTSSGSVEVNNLHKASDENLRGIDSAYKVSETYSRAFKATLSANSPSISCGSKGAVIDWQNLSGTGGFTINSESTRSRSRTIFDSSGKALSQTSLTSTGSQQLSIPTLSYTTGSVSFDKKLSFVADQKIIDNQTVSYARVETIDSEALVLRQGLSLSTGEFNVTTIVAGSISSKTDSGLRVILHYDRLELGAKGSCLPSQGTVTGEVYNSATSKIPNSSFELVFASSGASIVFSDGVGSDVQLEGCDLNQIVK